jgi:hypothetical protein
MWPRRSTTLGQGRAHRAPDAQHVDLEDPLPVLAGDAANGRDRRLGHAALATATSRPPKRSTVSATAACIAPWSVTSAPIPIAPRADPLGRFAGLLEVEVDHGDRGAARVHLTGGLVADSPGGAVISATFPFKS